MTAARSLVKVRWLGAAALAWIALSILAFLAFGSSLDAFSPLEIVLASFVPALALAVAAFVAYRRLGAEERRRARVAPLALILALLLPVLLLGAWMFTMAGMGNA